MSLVIKGSVRLQLVSLSSIVQHLRFGGQTQLFGVPDLEMSSREFIVKETNTQAES